MSLPIIILGVLGGLTLLGLLIICILIWIGRGESDVNGEKERDAGWSAAEIRMNHYLAARRLTVEASVRAEALAGNRAKEAAERAALAEIHAMQIQLQTQR